jgi:CHAD domain-containing protein
VAWRFQPGEPLREEFSRLALEEVERASTFLSASGAPNEHAVHQARRSFKKLRALVRLARPSLGASFTRENHRWRDAGRLLSASRDATVLLGSFDRLANEAGLSADAAGELRERLSAGKLSAKSSRESADPLPEVIAVLEAAREEIPRLEWPADLKDLKRGLRESQGRLKRSWKLARQKGDSETLHDWRKRVKDTASHLGLFRAVLPPELKESRNATKALGEILGEEHDLALLCEGLSPHAMPARLREKASGLIEAIGARRQWLREEALRNGEALSSRPAKALAEEVVSRWREAGAAARMRSGLEAEERRA